MNREQKTQVIENISKLADESAGLFFVDYTGMNVEEANTLRRKFQKEGIEYIAVKNTLAKLALKDKPFASVTDNLAGTPTAIVIAKDDAVSAAKSTYEFIKKCEHLKVKSGIVDGQIMSVNEVESLSKMKSKAEILAEVLSVLLGPARNLAGLLKGPASMFAGAMKTVAEKQES